MPGLLHHCEVVGLDLHDTHPTHICKGLFKGLFREESSVMSAILSWIYYDSYTQLVGIWDSWQGWLVGYLLDSLVYLSTEFAATNH